MVYGKRKSKHAAPAAPRIVLRDRAPAGEAHFHIFQDVQGHWRWHLMTADQDIFAESSGGYVHEADCLTAMGLVMDTNRATAVVRGKHMG